MCGIIAVLRRDGQPVDRRLLASMTRHLAHRGPDDQGIHVDGAVGLGFRRLAILDLTSMGNQPMLAPGGNAVLIFNGEIFNYVELREELRAAGHAFRSTGDAEVLLHSYLEWGPRCVERFNGEWAFLIHDRYRRVLFGSRDRFGIKPLYRLETPEVILWASEIKALLAFPPYRRSISWSVAAPYLLEGLLDSSHGTFFTDINSVPAATAFETRLDGAERQWTYWSLPVNGENTALEDPPRRFAETFEDAVRIRLRSDVPVGVCVSGGLDSTSVICAMARLRDGTADSVNPIQAFSYHHPDFDEQQYVAATIAQTGARLHRLMRDHGELWSLAEAVIRAHDEPVHSLTAVVGFELMREIAAAGTRVILNGQGADETLAGYDSYFPDAWYTMARSGHGLQAWQQMRAFSVAHHRPVLPLVVALLRRLFKSELRRIAAYRRLAHWKQRTALARHGWFLSPLIPGPDLVPPFEPLNLDASLRRSTTVSPLPLYLRVEDRNSMAHSVEVRLPLLDYRLVELAFRLAPEWKIRGEWNKFLLREAMAGRIPEPVRARVDKMGFPAPDDRLLCGKIFERLFELVTSRKARERGIYNMEKMVGDLEQARDRPNRKMGLRLFRVAQFETWAREFNV